LDFIISFKNIVEVMIWHSYGLILLISRSLPFDFVFSYKLFPILALSIAYLVNVLWASHSQLKDPAFLRITRSADLCFLNFLFPQNKKENRADLIGFLKQALELHLLSDESLSRRFWSEIFITSKLATTLKWQLLVAQPTTYFHLFDFR